MRDPFWTGFQLVLGGLLGLVAFVAVCIAAVAAVSLVAWLYRQGR